MAGLMLLTPVIAMGTHTLESALPTLLRTLCITQASSVPRVGNRVAVVCLSSTEAELYAAVEATKEGRRAARRTDKIELRDVYCQAEHDGECGDAVHLPLQTDVRRGDGGEVVHECSVAQRLWVSETAR